MMSAEYSPNDTERSLQSQQTIIDSTTQKTTDPLQIPSAASQQSTTSKVVSLLDVNKISDWKSTLSGALNDQQLFWALFVLGIFSIFYILVNTTHNDESKDEDSIKELCKCNKDHRRFYIILFSICTLSWVIFHFLLALLGCFNCSVSDCLIECCSNKCCNTKQPEDNHQPEDKCQWYLCCCCRKVIYKIYDQFKFYILNKEKLSRYEFHLWTQYCELYTIGITKNTENFNLDCVEALIKETLKGSAESTNEVDTKVVYDATTVLPKYHKECGCRGIVQGLFFIFIKVIQFTAQLCVVPLLIIQMYDTYAFLCFAEDSYCTTREEYNLHLDQTAFTFGFYTALMVSLLTTTMLQWIPWPVKPNPNNKP